VLNLHVTHIREKMNRFAKLLPLILVLAALAATPATAQGQPIIQSPQQGEVVQGTVIIRGSSSVTGFLSAELDFGYSGDPTSTWFLITTTSQPLDSDTLASWDTTAITDGNYDLRLRVYLSNGTHIDSIVQNLRVRNYTAVETPTPAPTPVQPTLTPTITLTLTPFPTPTALAANPAVLRPFEISSSFVYGGLGAAIFLIIFGLYTWLRRK